jgi:putative endopeptidase
MFMLTGADAQTAAKNANSVLALETEIAKTHRSPVELRDPQANYNKMSVANLEKISPNVGWANYFQKLGVKVDSVNVGQPGYYEGLSKLLASQPIEAWKTKLKFDYIASNAGLLSKDFATASFEFGKTFNGQKKDSERWKKMTNRVNSGLGEMLGQIYVKKYFNETAKQRMDELVNNLQKAFDNRIQNLDWMSAATKERATTKLHTFLKKIGYPEKWKNYDDVTIDKNNFFANAKSVTMHNQKEEMSKIGKPVDRMEWGMSPPTVNAYYNPTNNEIVFPAGILQFPFFDANADDAINYGAIGMVIGHEMTHGFDDQGCQYDEKGNMKNWWTSEDSTKFKSKTGGVVNQYNSYVVLNDQHVNGALTLGENLADIGGLAIAYDAFKMTKQGKDSVRIDGFTPDQRFFLGYAQVWRLKNRDEILRTRINTDPHSPEMFRVNGPAANFDPFYAAFNVQPTNKMYIKPEERAHIW